MGRNVGYIRLGITRGCHLGVRSKRVLFVSFRSIFHFAVRNVGYQSGSVRPRLKPTKRANETSAEVQMKEIEELILQEPHMFKSKANEDQ